MSRALPVIKATPEQCARFMRRALRLDEPCATVAEAIRHHGYIQLDPIDVCGRMHDLILRNRVHDYRRDGLLETIYAPGPREFFEHYIPERGIIVALPVEEYRYLLPAMKARRTSTRYLGALDEEQTRLARKILRRIRDEGPLGTVDFEDKRITESIWGFRSSLVKLTLDKLFVHGRLLIARREKFRRIYDLPERVLPPEIARSRAASPKDVARWLAFERIKQRRLVGLTAAHLALLRPLVAEVRLAERPPLYCLREDLELFAKDAPPPGRTLLLAPLDPLVYDRNITRRIWNFDYIWEVYTPPARRVRGYYALPVLHGERIVGHADPRADRKAGALLASVEAEVSVEAPLRELADFLGLPEVSLTSSVVNSQ